MKSRGFTVVELLIVITIIAVILAVVLSVFFGKKGAMNDHRATPHKNVTITPADQL